MSFRRNFSVALASLLAVSGAGFFNPAQAGSLTYEIDVSIPVSGLMSGMGGLVDMAMTVATPPGSPTVSVNIYDPSYDGAGQLFPANLPNPNAGTATGDLLSPGGVTENNTQSASDLNQNFTVGTSFFDVFVTLSGTEIGSGGTVAFSTTAFYFNLYDSDGGDAMATFVVNADGTVGTSGTTGVSVIPGTGTIPEPSSVLLLGLGLGAIGVAGRFRNRRAA